MLDGKTIKPHKTPRNKNGRYNCFHSTPIQTNPDPETTSLAAP